MRTLSSFLPPIMAVLQGDLTGKKNTLVIGFSVLCNVSIRPIVVFDC